MMIERLSLLDQQIESPLSSRPDLLEHELMNHNELTMKACSFLHVVVPLNRIRSSSFTPHISP